MVHPTHQIFLPAQLPLTLSGVGACCDWEGAADCYIWKGTRKSTGTDCGIAWWTQGTRSKL